MTDKWYRIIHRNKNVFVISFTQCVCYIFHTMCSWSWQDKELLHYSPSTYFIYQFTSHVTKDMLASWEMEMRTEWNREGFSPGNWNHTQFTEGAYLRALEYWLNSHIEKKVRNINKTIAVTREKKKKFLWFDVTIWHRRSS